MTIRTLCTAALVWAVLCLLAWAFVYAATKNDRRVDEERLQMTDIDIFKILRSGGMTAAGALGTMGNMRGESAMRSDNAQDSSGVDDAQYTAAVDTGNPEFLERFCRDQIGYGLCQWTHPDRKRKLLAFAMNRGVSIGDAAMQVHFCLKEMREDFPSVWRTVTSSDDLLQCTQAVLVSYENPKAKNLEERYQYAKEFAARLANLPAGQAEIPTPVQQRSDPIVRMLQACMAHNGYWPEDKINGIKDQEFREAIVKYAADVAGC